MSPFVVFGDKRRTAEKEPPLVLLQRTTDLLRFILQQHNGTPLEVHAMSNSHGTVAVISFEIRQRRNDLNVPTITTTPRNLHLTLVPLFSSRPYTNMSCPNQRKLFFFFCIKRLTLTFKKKKKNSTVTSAASLFFSLLTLRRWQRQASYCILKTRTKSYLFSLPNTNSII